MTSHITNQHNAFITYQPLTNRSVSGVGGLKAIAEGNRTVEVESICNGQIYILWLENILYIPSNPYNLFSLGCWDTSGGHYTRGAGGIILITKDGKSVTYCKKVSNHLCQMKLTIQQSGSACTKCATVTPQTYLTS